MRKLIKALYKIVGMELKKSGNILHTLRTLDEEVAITLAEVYYKKKAKEEEVFKKGINFGLDYKNKNSFYRVVLNNYVLYFVGTEAEIIKKINDKLDEKKKKEEKVKEEIVTID